MIYFVTKFQFGFFKIHPILFYVTLINLLFHYCKNTYFLYVVSYKKVLVGILSLILGSIWSLYTLEWNYYWSYDVVEIILFTILVHYLIIIHSKNNRVKFNSLGVLSVVGLLFLLRVQWLKTRHNFFSNNSKLVFCSYTLVIFKSYSYILKKFKNYRFPTISGTSVYVCIMFMVVMVFNFNQNNVFYIVKKQYLHLLTIGLLYFIIWESVKNNFMHILLFVVYGYFMNYYTKYIKNYHITFSLHNFLYDEGIKYSRNFKDKFGKYKYNFIQEYSRKKIINIFNYINAKLYNLRIILVNYV